MTTGYVAEGRDREDEPEPEARRDPERADGSRSGLDDDRDAAETHEEEEECSECLCGETSRERLIHFSNLRGVAA